jgi:hypothetical protein
VKTLKAQFLQFSSEKPPLDEVAERLDSLPGRHSIDTVNWKEFSYRPDVNFSIAYSEKEIFLKYRVTEQSVKAEKGNTNEMVCEDSCVEFFVSPSDDGIYYNFEFNPIGTCLLGCGTGRADSKRVDPETVNKIRRLGSEGSVPFAERHGMQSWSVTIAIPLEVFFRHEIESLKGKKFRANFYKCGDKLTVPHFVTWSTVGTPAPDYHQPSWFGEILFI